MLPYSQQKPLPRKYLNICSPFSSLTGNNYDTIKLVKECSEEHFDENEFMLRAVEANVDMLTDIIYTERSMNQTATSSIEIRSGK